MRNTIVMLIIAFSLAFFGSCSKKVAVAPEPAREKIHKTAPTPAAPIIGKDIPVVIQEEKTETPVVRPSYSYRDIHFDFDRYNLKPEEIEILSQHARQLKQNPNTKVLIEGHCDERGTIEYNLALGERRSNSVKNFLIKYGIGSDRLSTISYGKERPIDPAHNPEAWAKNRRAALVIKS